MVHFEVRIKNPLGGDLEADCHDLLSLMDSNRTERQAKVKDVYCKQVEIKKTNKLFLVILLRMNVRVCGCAVESEQAGKYVWEPVSVS